MSNAPEIIRDILLKIKPTGSEGFEGLLARVLEEVVGVPFRLSMSGAQYGVDALPAYSADSVVFEAKRYDEAVPRDKVLVKIQDIALRSEGKDLWILGATTAIGSQLVSDIHLSATNLGIAAVVLDWSNVTLPPLAVVLTMAEKSVADFLSVRLDSPDLIALGNAFHELRTHHAFETHASRIIRELSQATIGAAVAKRLNRLWLRDIFSNSIRSRQYFNQAVSPGESASSSLDRTDFENKVRAQYETAPDGKFLLVVGEEGTGKSWLVAKTWLGLESPPLTIFLPAESVPTEFSANVVVDLIIKEIIQQTDSVSNAASLERWKRILAKWRNLSISTEPRLVVILDGINERAELDWGRIVDSLNAELTRIGGKLVVTARTEYFNLRVRSRLAADHVRLVVTRWTAEERDQILQAHSISTAAINASVADTLRNPRILSLTIKLLDRTAIESLTELTVTRLLFEYLRFQEMEAPSPLRPDEFAQKLQGLAREVLSRTQANSKDDLMVFQGGLGAVGSGLFFRSIAGDASRYALQEQGLDLALGFALVDVALHASRNRHNISEKLTDILEPIAALDRSASALFAALTIVCVDESYSDDVCAPFVEALLGLQNVSHDLYPPFCELGRSRIEAFLSAAANRARKASHNPRGDWLRSSLATAADVESLWIRMKPILSKWLRTYSLEARPRYLARDISANERTEKFEKAREVIAERIRELTDAEAKLLSLMFRDDSAEVADLAELAFVLMAGKPLAEFGLDFVAWRFGTAINSNFDDPHTLFAQLIRFSSADWTETRQALLAVCAPLRSDPSYCGAWALHGVLAATGDPSDARDALELYVQLTSGQPRMEGVGRFTGICSTDPCDPGSHEAEISETIQRFTAIDVGELRKFLSMTGSDHDLARACCAIARFATEVGVAKYRELVDHVLKRSGFPLRQGLFELRRHNMLIGREDAIRLVSRVQDGTAGNRDPELNKSDRHIAHQYHLVLAFPQLEFEEQLDAMLAPGSTSNFLLELLPLIKRPNEDVLVRRFRSALDDRNELSLFLIMIFCAYFGGAMPSVMRDALPDLARDASPRIRKQAVEQIASSTEPVLWRFFSASGWRADDVVDTESRERWYGSWILIKAARHGILSAVEAMDRIDPSLYGVAARELGGEAALRFGAYLDAAIRQSVGAFIDGQRLHVEMPHVGGSELDIPRFRAEIIEPEPADAAEAMRRFAESDEAIREKSRSSRTAFQDWKESARKKKLDVLLHDMRLDTLEAVVRSNPALGESWLKTFADMPISQRSTMHHIGVMLVGAFATSEPVKAATLLAELERISPLVWYTFGKERLTLGAVVAWSLSGHDVFEQLRFQRLDEAANDAEIAMEVIAALSYGRNDVLEKYILDRLNSGMPSVIARALTVCGFSIASEKSLKILSDFRDSCGFIGAAAKAATEAYERHVWACYWFDAMCASVAPNELWRYSQLFRKVVDARFEVVLESAEQGTELFELYRPSIVDGLHNRYEKRQNKREKTLFGSEAPDRSFFERVQRLRRF